MFVTGYMSSVRDFWFQHNGVTGHIAKKTALLQEFFSERIVGRRVWPPDLNLSDTFLWDFLKDRVYYNSTWSLEEIK